jgi:hypothetical protein
MLVPLYNGCIIAEIGRAINQLYYSSMSIAVNFLKNLFQAQHILHVKQA